MSHQVLNLIPVLSTRKNRGKFRNLSGTGCLHKDKLGTQHLIKGSVWLLEVLLIYTSYKCFLCLHIHISTFVEFSHLEIREKPKRLCRMNREMSKTPP